MTDGADRIASVGDRAILRHKGLPFRTVDYNGLKALRARKLWPVGKLPVIDYDGERIAGSSRIA